jgi:hypothetical protein
VLEADGDTPFAHDLAAIVNGSQPKAATKGRRKAEAS